MGVLTVRPASPLAAAPRPVRRHRRRHAVPGAAARTAALVAVAALPWRAHLAVVDHQNVWLVDPILAVVVVMALTQWIGPRALRCGRIGWLAVAMVALTAIAYAVHPAWAGALLLLRMAGSVGVAAILWWSPPSTVRRVCVILATTVLLQVALGAAQLVNGGQVGFSIIGEPKQPMYVLGGITVPEGTFSHQYLLAAFSLVATFALLGAAARSGPPRALIGVTALAAAPIGMTFSRSALLGFVLGSIAVVASPRCIRARAPLLAAWVVVGALAAGLSGGWTSRVDTSVSTSANGLTSGRIALMHEALRQIGRTPIAGIGPARWVQVIHPDSPSVQNKPVHDAPLLAATETGIPNGLVVLALIVGLGWLAARRRSGEALALYAAMLPFLLLDLLNWTDPQGQLTTGVWAAAVLVLSRRPGEVGGYAGT